MSFPLKYLELHLDNHQLEQAEALLAQKAFLSLTKIERNLWSGMLLTDQEYETEIKLVNGKVNNFSCDCIPFRKNKTCTHVVATLLMLRHKIDSIQEEVVQQKKETKHKLSTAQILKSVPPDSLLLFVKEYAKKHRNFALDLKTKFASLVPGNEDSDRYDQILSSALSMHKSKNGIINKRGVKQIEIVCQELLSQSEDQIALKRYTEAYPILSAILFKIPPSIKYDDESYLNDIYYKAFELLNQILLQDISPAFKRNIFEFISQELPLWSIFENNLEAEYFNVLQKLAIDISETDIIYELLEEWQQDIPLSKKNRVNVLVLKINLLEKEGKSKEAQALIDENLSNPSILYIAVEEAKKQNDWPKIEQIGKASLSKLEKHEDRSFIHNLLFEASRNLNKPKDFQHYGILRFLESFDFRYIDEMVDAKPDSADLIYDSVMIGLEKQTYSKSKRNAIAEIHFRRKEIKELFNYIEKLGSLELLQSFDQNFLPKRKKKIYSLYKYLVSEYLDNHLGRVPAQKISSLIHHLKKIAAHDLAYDLMAMIKEKYAERHSLMDEIQLL